MLNEEESGHLVDSASLILTVCVCACVHVRGCVCVSEGTTDGC